jgi:predicted aconitase with swiveling domain
MPSGRGSSSSSSVLAEAVRLGTSPAAIILLTADAIVALGSIVAGELYGRALPVLVLEAADYRTIRSGDPVHVETQGPLALVRVMPAGSAG